MLDLAKKLANVQRRTAEVHLERLTGKYNLAVDMLGEERDYVRILEAALSAHKIDIPSRLLCRMGRYPRKATACEPDSDGDLSTS